MHAQNHILLFSCCTTIALLKSSALRVGVKTLHRTIQYDDNSMLMLSALWWLRT